jgi:hypothetical protein
MEPEAMYGLRIYAKFGRQRYRHSIAIIEGMYLFFTAFYFIKTIALMNSS